MHMWDYGRKIVEYIFKKRVNALTYVQSLNAGVRHIATEAILECLKLGYPLNNMEITSKAREMQRMRMRARA